MISMTIQDIEHIERANSGTSPTNNKQFDEDGYLVVRDLWDPQDLFAEPPEKKGVYRYHGAIDKFSFFSKDPQVQGATARYHYPPYSYIHSQIRLKLERLLGKKLYNSYFFDRFYDPGQELEIHVDRPACEISVTIHVRSNAKTPWPFWIKTPDIYEDPLKKTVKSKGKNHSILLNPGDGVIYKGCERPHWREPMAHEYERTWYGLKKEKEGLFYHQVFFHYVLADGLRAQCANDMAPG